MNEFVTSDKGTIAHYRTPGIMEAVLRFSQSGDSTRWANGDKNHWYRTSKKTPIKMTELNYKTLTYRHRTLYNSLSLFHANIFKMEFGELTSDEKKNRSRQHVTGYTLGIDIDTVDEINGHGINIRDPEVKEAVEAAAQFFSNKLREFAPNSVYCLFSGGGIYVFLHHEVLKPFFDRIGFSGRDDYTRLIKTLTDAINTLTTVYADEFFEKTQVTRNM